MSNTVKCARCKSRVPVDAVDELCPATSSVPGPHLPVADDEQVADDPRVTHVGKLPEQLTPAEARARRDLARRVITRQPVITSTSFRRAAWFVR